jgi:hypothetical protein
MNKKVSSFGICLAIFIIFISPTTVFSAVEDELIRAEADYRNCLTLLPPRVRQSLAIKSEGGQRKIPHNFMDKVNDCLDKEKERDDLRGVMKLSEEMLGMGSDESSGDVQESRNEAIEIARTLIGSTRELNKRYKMGRSALFHNFLIKVGAKEGGYCYQWVRELLKAMPPVKYRHFERHWGVHKKDKYTENNAIIITWRGEPISAGIVYDAWRGRGSPFWRCVADDTQSWSELYGEDDILYGGILTPSASSYSKEGL